MNDDSSIDIHDGNSYDNSDSDKSDRSESSVKSDPGTRTFIVSVPANKSIKVPNKASMKEIPTDCSISDIVEIIQATEKIVNTVNIECCSSCYKIFGKCLKIKITDNEVKL